MTAKNNSESFEMTAVKRGLRAVIAWVIASNGLSFFGMHEADAAAFVTAVLLAGEKYVRLQLAKRLA